MIATVLTGACVLAGAGAALSAGLGLLRLPDLLSRMHAATKPQAVGLLMVLVAVGVRFPTGGVITTLLLVALLQLTTVPIAAHMVGRAAYRTGRVPRHLLYVDELDEALSPVPPGAGERPSGRGPDSGGEEPDAEH
ncbi:MULTISPECIES: monovalent cation/H(+) antiporter subunit G [Actinomadura]|uniref:Monovalent cation/H(+) antiporter subunit G n=1 Tax=Actinomadura yumaensis TaxID=111807 RepID=A0ABW2CVW1_9ACTN|nr:monovalent cation/H(+) antiporter subunit G [Actinomadura sp. J1-007]MWK40224.1 Na+/H+ antiporter subunit G [Actinomadura sp. J1-007]